MVSGQALADTVSQIGKKVDSEASVFVDGNKVSDAVIIKGKSYVPGRDVAEALGAKVEWKGSQGVMITSDTATNTTGFNFTTEEELAEYNAKVKEYQDNHIRLTAAIEGTKYRIESLTGSIEHAEKQIEKGFSTTLFDQSIAEFKKELAKLQEELAQYEKELEELESTK
ncbi:hypothetical protein J40TS1_00440 [Paenibacillus montaniterrae]|uniref:Copper amine oxidase-like N-terminal domain-containing protein n=2 Tax=Paenibacillus montaniterrae TaxID=429341 RepID=A0A919YHE3_9BACL|nr:hypothetical protein J40TS1_00440 [Paenibacillus montaniterrae]